MPTQYEFDEGISSFDYFRWFQRVLGWDAVLPVVVLLGSIGIANAFKHQPPADIIALVGLPVVGFLIRFAAGRRQIECNGCGNMLRLFQISALMLALFGLVIVDFFTALSAIIPKGNPQPDEVGVVCLAAFSAYLTLATFAMYPGRRLISRGS